MTVVVETTALAAIAERLRIRVKVIRDEHATCYPICDEEVHAMWGGVTRALEAMAEELETAVASLELKSTTTGATE